MGTWQLEANAIGQTQLCIDISFKMSNSVFRGIHEGILCFLFLSTIQAHYEQGLE